MSKFSKFVKNNPRLFLAIGVIAASAYIMIKLGLDVRAVAIITIVMGFVAQVFTGLTVLLGMIPVIGPIMVKALTLPIIWIVNAGGSLTSVYAVKKGYGRDLVSFNFVVLILIIGIIAGYILGQLIPVKGYHRSDRGIKAEQPLHPSDISSLPEESLKTKK